MSSVLIATLLALVGTAFGATVDGSHSQESKPSDPCVDSDGNAITIGFCNKPLVISIAVVLSTLLLIALAAVVFLQFRRKQTDSKMMSELGIDTKRSSIRGSGETSKIVKVKLPGLAVTIPAGKVSGDLARSPDSIIGPSPFHVGQ